MQRTKYCLRVTNFHPNVSLVNSRTEELDSRMDSQETETDNLLARLSGQRTLTTLQELFNSCPNGLSFFISSAGSVDVPAQNTAWLYGSGIVLKRNTSDAVVVLYAYNSTQFAINSTVNGGATWLGWQIKS